MVSNDKKNKEKILNNIMDILKDYNQIELEIIAQIIRFLKNLEERARSK